MARDFAAAYSAMGGTVGLLRDGRTTVTDTLKGLHGGTLEELQGVVDDFGQVSFTLENASDAYRIAYDEFSTSSAADAVNDMAQALDRAADRIRNTDVTMAGSA